MTRQLSKIQKAAADQFEKQSHRYARGHILDNVTDVREALEFISLPTSADVLDVATGAGFTGLHLAGLGHRVVFSDLTPAMLDRAREAAEARSIVAEFRQHPAEELPYANERFDLVTCRVAPHHFDSPSAFVAEAARVLKPGGTLLVIDGTVPDGHPEAEAWIHQVEKLRDPSHNRFVTPGNWSTLCEHAGLVVDRCMLKPRKQPNLDWYFETANTPEANRAQVRHLVDAAPGSARELFSIATEEEKTIWWWPMLTLIAIKPGGSLE